MHYDFIERHHPILKLFDKKVLSYRLKTRKPLKKIFRHAMSLSHAKAEEIFYIDDRQEMTRAALKDHGVHAHTFKNAGRLINTMKRLGIVYR